MDSSRPRRRAAKVDYTEHNPVELERKERELQKQLQKEREREMKEKEKLKKKQGSSTPEVLETQPHQLMNWQPRLNDTEHPFPSMYNLEGALVHDGLVLELKNGDRLVKGDNVFLVCEPPGEPYYCGRIMGFVKKNGTSKAEDLQGTQPAQEFLFKVNWWYRCRDISKHSVDSRILYASMHSDTCPLQSFRGRCTVKHRDEIEDFEAYKRTPNQFWFEKLFDRYMIKFYDVIPTVLLTNLPQSYATALHKRFQYIFVEQGRAKEMLQSPKSCVRCNQWCSPTDSVQCCECDDLYHLLCLDPPIFKKPARGFAWSCINCVKKIEQKKMIPSLIPEVHNNEILRSHPVRLPLYEELAIVFLEKDKANTFEMTRNKEEWVYRYLGMHAKLEDALDLEDRPYPRAASRLGPKHQLAGMQPWLGHHLQYFDPSELNEEFQGQAPSTGRKKKGGRRRNKTIGEELQPLPLPQEYQDTPPDEFPSWLQPRPEGYIERGGDDTVTLMWDQSNEKDETVEKYVEECAPIAKSLNLLANTPNFMDAILKNLLDCQYDYTKAMDLNKQLTRETLREPTFTEKEIQLFENGVRKYGSELWPTFKEVNSQSFAMVVRFYYLWKKTKNGHLIWDNFEGRKKYKSKKQDADAEDADLANSGDDSSYDVSKSKNKKFQCKHCKTDESIQWFRAYGAQHPENEPDTVMALCKRCARIWRRYAVLWEDPNDVMKRIAMKGITNINKRKIEAELLLDSEMILKMVKDMPVTKKRKSTSADEASLNGKSKKSSPSPTSETPKKMKKQAVVDQEDVIKEEPLRDVAPLVNYNESQSVNLQQILTEHMYLYTSPIYNSKLKYREPNVQKPSQNGSVASIPRPNKSSVSIITLCGLCRDSADYTNALHCQGCGLTVHPMCYGVPVDQNLDYGMFKWFCDPCSNTLNPIVSTDYECSLCHAHDSTAPLKRTASGKWIHIQCCLFVDDIKFGDVNTMQPILGYQKFILDQMRDPTSEFSRECQECHKKVSMSETYRSNGYKVGFFIEKDLKPDSKSVKPAGVSGKLRPVLYCSEHTPPSTFIPFSGEIKRKKLSGLVSALKVFLDDNKKAVAGIPGAQRQFHYLNLALKGATGESQRSAHKMSRDQVLPAVRVCKKCGVKKTLKWSTVDGESICFSCSSNADEDVKMYEDDFNGMDLLNTTMQNLDGSVYGINSVEERLVRPAKKEPSPVQMDGPVTLPQLHIFTKENLPPKSTFQHKTSQSPSVKLPSTQLPTESPAHVRERGLDLLKLGNGIGRRVTTTGQEKEEENKNETETESVKFPPSQMSPQIDSQKDNISRMSIGNILE